MPFGECATAYLLHNGLRVMVGREVKPSGVAVAKASPKWATQWPDIDPKPSDLPMSRMKGG